VFSEGTKKVRDRLGSERKVEVDDGIAGGKVAALVVKGFGGSLNLPIKKVSAGASTSRSKRFRQATEPTDQKGFDK
jgi:hypothetical protein